MPKASVRSSSDETWPWKVVDTEGHKAQIAIMKMRKPALDSNMLGLYKVHMDIKLFSSLVFVDTDEAGQRRNNRNNIECLNRHF